MPSATASAEQATTTAGADESRCQRLKPPATSVAANRLLQCRRNGREGCSRSQTPLELRIAGPSIPPVKHRPHCLRCSLLRSAAHHGPGAAFRNKAMGQEKASVETVCATLELLRMMPCRRFDAKQTARPGVEEGPVPVTMPLDSRLPSRLLVAGASPRLLASCRRGGSGFCEKPLVRP